MIFNHLYFKNIKNIIVKSEELIVNSTKFAIKYEYKLFIIHYSLLTNLR